MDAATDPFAPLPPLGATPPPPAEKPARAASPVILPAPLPLPEVIRHRGHGTPSQIWRYHDAEGRLLFAVARFNKPEGGKEVLPYTATATGWGWKAPPEPRPLYGLHDLAQRPVAPVLLVEGEKAAGAALALFPDHVAMTWQGGAKAIGKADLAPLAGRAVILWPDNDAPGRDCAAALVPMLNAAGAASVAVVAVPEDWPAKWDVADPLPDGVEVETLAALLAVAVVQPAPPDEPTQTTDDAAPMPRNFILRRSGVWWQPDPLDGERDAVRPVHVCGPLRIVAATNDGNGRAWGSLLRWQDGDGRRHEWAMPRAMLAGDGQEVRSHLLDGGLYLASGRKAREKLAEYLTRAEPPMRVRVVGRIGWHGAPGGRVFVLPDSALGQPEAGRVMLQTERPESLPPLVQSGTLAEWQRDIAAHAVANSRLAFALCASFAAPLMALVNAEGGGFHLRGGSSLGKTTALHAAGSVWGGGGLRGWPRSWRTTDNALESVAAAHCDLLLALDEMGEAPAETVAACAYALANGTGKGRAARDGSARRVAEWRVLFLSTGEEGLADRLAEARGGPRRVRAGQEVRVLDIPAEAGPHGLFEVLHGFPQAAALADHLKAAADRCHGTAGRAWLELLAADPEGIGAAAREAMDGFLASRVATAAGGQVRRAAGRFALAAAAGELAAGCGILPWQPGEAERAAAACFDAWRGARAGGDGAAEDAAAVAAVRAFIGAHGESRFQALGKDDGPEVRPIINRAGWRKREGDGWRFLILSETWQREVVAGMDPKAAANALHRAGFLEKSGEKPPRIQRRERVGLSEPVRVYVIRDAILGGGE